MCEGAERQQRFGPFGIVGDDDAAEVIKGEAFCNWGSRISVMEMGTGLLSDTLEEGKVGIVAIERAHALQAQCGGVLVEFPRITDAWQFRRVSRGELGVWPRGPPEYR